MEELTGDFVAVDLEGGVSGVVRGGGEGRGGAY